VLFAAALDDLIPEMHEVRLLDEVLRDSAQSSGLRSTSSADPAGWSVIIDGCPLIVQYCGAEGVLRWLQELVFDHGAPDCEGSRRRHSMSPTLQQVVRETDQLLLD